LPAASSPAGSAGSGFIRIVQYADTIFNKQIIAVYGYRADDATNYESNQQSTTEWESAAAVNRIDIVLPAGNFVYGSVFRLYGEN